MTLFQNHFTTIRPSKQVLLASVLFREIVSLKSNLDLFFTWLLVPFYLTDVLFLVLFYVIYITHIFIICLAFL